VFVHLLPYFDQAPLFNRIDFANTSQAAAIENQVIDTATGRTLRQTVMTMLRCPSDDHAGSHNGDGLSNYAPSSGSQLYPNTTGCTIYTGNEFGTGAHGHGSVHLQSGCSSPGGSNGVNGTCISGMFARWGWGAKIREVTDGTSNTVMMGEVRPLCGDHYHLGGGWAGFNFMWTGMGPINWGTCPDDPLSSVDGSSMCYDIRDWGMAHAFKSRHEGGAQFLLADGSVRFISENIDMRNYQRLGDRRDNEVVGEF
jgi:prepilin-type processing-associated H-X9-DG protein